MRNQKEEERYQKEQTREEMTSKKKQDGVGGRGRAQCFPLGSYFKALKDVFEENSYKMHLFTKMGNHSDWADAHTHVKTLHTHTHSF